jgi:hypothetical protein
MLFLGYLDVSNYLIETVDSGRETGRERERACSSGLTFRAQILFFN